MQGKIIVVVGDEIMQFVVEDQDWYIHANEIGRIAELGLRFATPEVVYQRVREIIATLVPPVSWVVRNGRLEVWGGQSRTITIP